MAPTLNSLTLDSLLDGFRRTAAALPDPRPGSNTRYSVTDAASCALAPFFMQDPSFLAFQSRMQDHEQRSNCQSLFHIERIPTDNCIRSLLDAGPADAFDALFPDCLDTLDRHGALQPFRRLDNRLLIALDGIEFHKSDTIHCNQCCTRHVGKAKTTQYFHSMVSAVVVADGHNRVIPLMPEFVGPQTDASATADLPPDTQKQDCERNASKTLDRQARQRLSYLPPGLPRRRPVLLPPPLPTPPRAPRRLDLRLQAPLPTSACRTACMSPCITPPAGSPCALPSARSNRIATAGSAACPCAMATTRSPAPGSNSPSAASPAAARAGSRLTTTRSSPASRSPPPTWPRSPAPAEPAGRSRTRVSTACPARATHLKHNFGHGSDGLANLLVVINLLAFAFHSVLDGLCDLWRQLRDKLGTRRAFFEHLRVLPQYFFFPHWTALLETILKKRPPPGLPRWPAPA